MPIGPRRQRGHLADQAAGLQPAQLQIVSVVRVGIESGERADRAQQHPHRMGVVAEALHELLDVLVHHRVNLDVVLPHLEVLAVGQFALDDQVGGFQVVAAFSASSSIG